MSSALQRTRGVLMRVWERLAAVIAVVLIIGALFVGYRIGHPTPAPSDEIASGDTIASSVKPQMYTCSMHPSVRLPDPDAKCPICFMELIPVTDGGGEENALRVTMNEAAAATSRIETARVARLFPTAVVRLFGKVSYDETSVARLTAYFPARIERLFVNYVGVPVSEGDHIAEVYSPSLLAAFEELRQSSKASDDASAMSDIVRDATRGTLTAARDKLRLYGLTDGQIAAIERGENLADALTVYAPIGGIVTHLAVREGDYVNEGAPVATVADLSRLWLDLEAYESQLSMLRWGQRVSFTTESHPGEVFEGQVSFIEPMIDERTRTAVVRVAVDNSDGRLKPGMFASAVVRPRMVENGAVVSDELAGRWVSPMHPTIVKDGPGACDVCGMDLVPAESLGVVGDPSQAREPLVIPRSAVLFTGKRSIVYIAIPDAEQPTYEGREVLLGPRAGDFYLVREGLRENERVVVNGAFRIDSAMQIAAKPSMMMPSGDTDNTPRSAHGSMQTGARRTVVPDSFIFALKPVYAAYLDAQEALAADDLGRFIQATDDLNTAIGFVQEAGLVGESLGAWRRAAATLRGGGAATTIERARERFERLSQAIISLQERFGHHGGETWRVAYCPMAFENTGAEWLQRGAQVNNPYFGASMLRCGEIRREFPPLNAEPSATHTGHEHE